MSVSSVAPGAETWTDGRESQWQAETPDGTTRGGSPVEWGGDHDTPHPLIAASSESMAPPRVLMCSTRFSLTASAGSSPPEISSKNAPAPSV